MKILQINNEGKWNLPGAAEGSLEANKLPEKIILFTVYVDEIDWGQQIKMLKVQKLANSILKVLIEGLQTWSNVC